MHGIPELDWPDMDRLPRGAVPSHPLALFSPGECGAWVDTLRALRALPDQRGRTRAPPRDAEAE